MNWLLIINSKILDSSNNYQIKIQISDIFESNSFKNETFCKGLRKIFIFFIKSIY